MASDRNITITRNAERSTDLNNCTMTFLACINTEHAKVEPFMTDDFLIIYRIQTEFLVL